MLRHFVSDELEAEKIDEFLSEEGAVCYFVAVDFNTDISVREQDQLYEYCQRPRRMIREVLEEFRSARIPREYVFDVFPPLRPRQFSIASSCKVGSMTAQ